MEKTLLIIKPDAVKRKLIGYIVGRLERAGLSILEMKIERLSPQKARSFYNVHEGKPFLDSLVEFMSSGPVAPILLEKENAISDLRALIGATDPAKAACGTLRQEIALNVQENSVHASDSRESAVKEIRFFFG